MFTSNFNRYTIQLGKDSFIKRTKVKAVANCQEFRWYERPPERSRRIKHVFRKQTLQTSVSFCLSGMTEIQTSDTSLTSYESRLWSYFTLPSPTPDTLTLLSLG